MNDLIYSYLKIILVSIFVGSGFVARAIILNSRSRPIIKIVMISITIAIILFFMIWAMIIVSKLSI